MLHQHSAEYWVEQLLNLESVRPTKLFQCGRSGLPGVRCLPSIRCGTSIIYVLRSAMYITTRGTPRGSTMDIDISADKVVQHSVACPLLWCGYEFLINHGKLFSAK